MLPLCKDTYFFGNLYIFLWKFCNIEVRDYLCKHNAIIMKKLLMSFFVACSISVSCFAQAEVYAKTSCEFIFTVPQIGAYNSSLGRALRFAPWLNLQETVNVDFKNIFGLSAGLSLKNVGFRYKFSPNIVADAEVGDVTKVFRTYTLGVPIGFKIGNTEKLHLYAGYEFEWPFLYREKSLTNQGKTKYNNEWTSDKTAPYYHSVFLGVNFPHHFGLKVKYYISEFFNPDFNVPVPDIPEIQYSQFHANVISVSLTYDFLKNVKFFYDVDINRKKDKDELIWY